MKKTTSILLSIGLSLTLGLSLCTALNLSKKEDISEVDAIGNYSTDASTYYNDITATSGKQLAAQLHDLITSTHRTYTSYDDNGGNGYQKQTDQYYENGSKVSGYIYEFYSGVKWPNAWAATAGSALGGYNREHCWCQSLSGGLWGTSGGGADMHHLRPVEVRLNSTRGNSLYGVVSNRDSNKAYAKYGSNETYALGGYQANNTFEPLDNKKGDVARIVLYTYLHYNSYKVSDLFGSYGTTNGSGSSSYFKTSLLPLTNVVKTSAGTEAKALELMLSWNTSDPVDEIELRRNEQVAIYQGNRNPFIDNSSYADMIWGTDTTGISTISKTSAKIAQGNTTTLSATSSNGGTISWSSSNTSVATVSSATASSGSSITITGVSAGSATITASITISGKTYSKTCLVTVTAPKALDSITLDTSEVTKKFKVNDTFSYTGLVVTAVYNDETTDTVTPTSVSSPDMTVEGEKTVTVSYTEGGVTRTATYKINVISSSTQSKTATVSIATYATANSWSNATKYISVALDSNIIASVGVGSSNTGKYYTSGNEWRFYQSESATIVITAGEDCELTSITFTYNVSNTGVLKQSSTTISSGSAVSVSGTSATFSVGNSGSATNGQVKFTAISVSYVVSSSSIAELSSIEVSDETTSFVIGAAFEFGGTVTATYSDSSNADVTEDCSFSGYDGETVGEQTITVSYTEGGVTKTTTYSISVKGLKSLAVSGQTITFDVDDDFAFDGTATLTYSDDTTEDVTSSCLFSGYDMSTADTQTVTVTYTINDYSVETSYTITVKDPAVLTIIASVSKTFYVGETITKSDITVVDGDDNEITDFTFVNNNYQFTFNDATSGGSLTSKTFTNAITYSTATCSLTVQVQRKAYADVSSVKDTITATGLGASGDTYGTCSNKTFTSSAVYTAQCMKDSSNNIQMRSRNSNSGLISTTSGGTIQSVKINVGSGTNTVQVYAKNTAYSSPSDLYSSSANTKGTLIGSVTATGTITFTDSYTYVGIRSASGAIYLSSIEITYGSSESPTNIANYIMYEDTAGQCTTKFSIAKGYFDNLSDSDKNTFMTSNDYVISTARTRLLDWAKHLGKTITQVNGVYVISNAKTVSPILSNLSSGNYTLTIILSISSGLIIAGYFYYRYRKEQ